MSSQAGGPVTQALVESMWPVAVSSPDALFVPFVVRGGRFVGHQRAHGHSLARDKGWEEQQDHQWKLPPKAEESQSTNRSSCAAAA